MKEFHVYTLSDSSLTLYIDGVIRTFDLKDLPSQLIRDIQFLLTNHVTSITGHVNEDPLTQTTWYVSTQIVLTLWKTSPTQFLAHNIQVPEGTDFRYFTPPQYHINYILSVPYTPTTCYYYTCQHSYIDGTLCEYSINDCVTRQPITYWAYGYYEGPIPDNSHELPGPFTFYSARDTI